MQNQSAKTCLDAKCKTMCKYTKHVASPKACKSRRTSLSFEPPIHQHQESIMWNVNISTYVLLSFLIFIHTILHLGSSRIPFQNWVSKRWRSSATIATNLQSPRVGLQPQGILALQFADVAPFQKGCQHNWVVSAWATKARPSDMGVSLCQCFTAVTLETTMAAVHRSPLMPYRHMSTTQRHIATCPTKTSRQDAATEFAKVFSSWWSRTRFSHASHYKLWLQRLISWF